MVHVILVSHGQLAQEMVSVLEMVTGPEKDIISLPFMSYEGMEQLTSKVEAELKKVVGKEVLIITDRKGGIPWQACVMLAASYRFTLMAGLNLIILLDVVFARPDAASAKELAEEVCSERIGILR